MIPGETIASGAADSCCGTPVVYRVEASRAGYYIGTVCAGTCRQHYSRESDYYRTHIEAERALREGWQARL